MTLIGLLDLSAAFDCVDQVLPLQRLHHQCGLSGTVLRWETSFVSGWTQQVAYNGQLSPVEPLLYGVPQGSVLGPLLFVLFTAEQHLVVESHHFPVPVRTSTLTTVRSTQPRLSTSGFELQMKKNRNAERRGSRRRREWGVGIFFHFRPRNSVFGAFWTLYFTIQLPALRTESGYIHVGDRYI